MKKMKRIEIAQYIALGATCLTVLGFVLSGIFGGRIPMSMMGYGVMAGIVSYFFGGFGTAVRMAGKIAMTSSQVWYPSSSRSWSLSDCRSFRSVRHTKSRCWMLK